MPTRTISIDLEAYDRLSQARRNGESFSEIIKRTVPGPFDVDAWLKELRRNGVSDATADAVEKHVAARRRRSRRSA
jgi:predicted CopG family antitoxin